MKYAVAICAFALIVACTMHVEAQRVKICEPKSVFMDDCNRCRCSDDGFDKSCTRIMCVKKPEGEAGRTRRDVDDETCVPGSRFNIDCNTCICPDSGKKAMAPCTLKACFGMEHERLVKRASRSSNHCIPGSMFKIDCNECICPSSGRREGAACTLMAC